ncbi:MAG TPA: septum formation initiator family protein [Chitinispirillaceae bacterium]|nr:septum formation initiator family protein [Chitinispirillaceae bacterium]
MKKRIQTIILVFIAVVLFFLAISLFGNQGFITVYNAHKEDRALSLQISDSKRTIDSLKDEIERLKSDTAYIERIAREKLGMARRNEKIYKFIEEKN